MAASYDESLATLQQLPKSLPYILPSHFYEDIPETPIPNPTPAENAFLHHDIGEQVGKTWKILHNIVIRHEAAIVAAWEKKSTKRRLALLTTAWGDKIPEHKRPDWWFFVSSFAEFSRGDIVAEDFLFGKSSKKATALTYPYINEVHLVQKRALPLLINSRGRGGPDSFYQFNVRQTNIGRCIDALLIPDLQGFRIDVTNEMSYGEIIPSTSTFHAYYLTAGETLMAMKIHDRVMKFLIRCCQLILNQDNLQILTSPNTPIPPEVKAARKTGWFDVANTIWEAPLVIPTPFNSGLIMDYLTVRASAAEDHVWDLRENPGYFAARVMEWSEHQRERMCFTDEKDILETGTPKFWNIVIREVIADAFESLVAWHLLHEQYHLIHRRQDEDDRALSRVCGISPDCAEEMYIFHYLLGTIADIRVETAWRALLVSPYNRGLWRQALGPEASPTKEGYKPNLDRDIPPPKLSTLTAMLPSPNTESNLITLTRLLDLHSRNVFGFTNMIDDMGYALAVNPLENSRMSACSQRLFSDLGLVASLQKEMEKHQTFSTKTLFLSGKSDVEMAQASLVKLAPYKRVGKKHRQYTRLAALGTPVKGRFDYPVNEKRTLEVTKRMQESEKNLREFWRKADEEYKEKTGMSPLDDVDGSLVFDSSIIGRTRDWVEPEKNDFVDKELLIRELCEEKLPKKKRRSKNTKATPKGEFDGNLGVTERFSADRKSSLGNENDLVNDNAKNLDLGSNPSMGRTSDSECVYPSEGFTNGQTEGDAAQRLQKPDNNEPKILEMEIDTATTDTTTPEAKAENTVGGDNNKGEEMENAIVVAAEVGSNGLEELEMETEITTEDTPSQIEAIEAKTHGVEVELAKEPDSRTPSKGNLGLEHPRYTGIFSADDSPDSCSEQENRIETKSSVNTASEVEYQIFECVVETFHPGCAAMMSGAIYGDALLTSESFSQIPDSEFRREVCPRRPALEALISNKPPLDQPWTQVCKKPADGAGIDCTMAVDPPGGNKENQLPLNLKSSQIFDSEDKRRAWWARQRRKSLDIPIQDESQRGRRRLQSSDELNDEACTGVTFARGFFEENAHTDPEKWWSRAMAAYRESDPWAQYESSPRPKLGRPRLDSDRFLNDKFNNYWYPTFDSMFLSRLGRRLSDSLMPKSRFMPEGPLDSYDPLEAAAEIYAQTNHLEDYTSARWDEAIGDSDWDEEPTWHHIEWKQVEDDGDLSGLDIEAEVGVIKEPRSPKLQATLQDDSSRSQSLSGESQKSNGILNEESTTTAFSTNTTVSPENPKLALAAREPAAQEEAILAYQEVNKSLENFAAPQSELNPEARLDICFPIQTLATPSGDGHIFTIHLTGRNPPINFLVTTQETPVLGTAYWEAIVADIAAVSEAWRWRHFNVDDLMAELARVNPAFSGLTVEETCALITSEAENQDTIPGLENSATRNLAACKTADFEISEDSNISPGDPGAYESSIDMESSLGGSMTSEAEGQDIIQVTEGCVIGELAQVDDQRPAQRQASIAIPWNLVGVRRGMKIPEIKWQAVPKPPSEEPEPKESQQDQSLEQGQSYEAELLQAIRSPSEETAPEDSQQDESPEQNQSLEQGQNYEAGLLQMLTSRVGEVITANQQSSEDTGSKESQEYQSPEHNQGSEAKFLRSRESEEWQAIRSKVEEAMDAQRSSEDELESTPVPYESEDIFSNASTENTGAEVVQSTGIDAKEATFAFTIPQDPHGYLNAYSKNPPSDSPKADPKPEPKDVSLGIFEELRGFATKLCGLDVLKEFASKYDNLKDFPKPKPKPKPELEPEPDHDVYYLSKPSYKVFSAIFDCQLDKQPPPSFIWSEFVAAMQEIEFTPVHEYATLWHFALKEEGVGIQIHQPHYQGVKKEGALNVKVSYEYARWIGRRLERNYGYGKAWFLKGYKEE